VTSPPVILADEPTGNLDTQTGDEIMKVFLELNAAGTTVVMVTHEREVADWCGRRLLIRDGKLDSDEINSSPRRAAQEVDSLADEAEVS
jgi:putative ABC transport system ATP-binding protein